MAQLLDMTHEVVHAASELYPLIRGNMARADEERRLPQENIDAMIDAGIFRVWVPRRYGGHEADVLTQQLMTAELSRACPATGWTVAMMTTTSWMGCCVPIKGQDEMFEVAGADTRFVGLFNPTDTPAKKVDGGYLVNGTWPFATGVLHAHWAEMPVPTVNDKGEVENVHWMFAPVDELERKDTWFTMGMRGTGSQTVTAKDVFVPEHRTVPMLPPDGILAGKNRNENKDEVLYRQSVAMIGTTCVAGSVLGAADAAFDWVVEKLPKRGIQYGPYTQATKAVSTQMQVAQAKTLIDEGKMHARRAAQACWDAAEAGALPSLEVRTRTRHDASTSIRKCKEAVDVLSYVAGASCMAQGNVFEQLYRDISVATLHGVLRVDVTEELYGAVLVGEEPVASFVY